MSDAHRVRCGEILNGPLLCRGIHFNATFIQQKSCRVIFLKRYSRFPFTPPHAPLFGGFTPGECLFFRFCCFRKGPYSWLLFNASVPDSGWSL